MSVVAFSGASRWFRRLLPAVVAGAGLCLSAGCYHVLQPSKARGLLLEEGQELLYGGRVVRLENGYTEAEIRAVGSDGFHHFEVDLREWSARLLLELAGELEARGARVQVDEAALEGTSVAPLLSASPHASAGAPGGRTLRVTVNEVQTPRYEAEAGLELSATVEDRAGELAAVYNAETKQSFSDIFFVMKKQILEDPSFQAWLTR